MNSPEDFISEDARRLRRMFLPAKLAISGGLIVIGSEFAKSTHELSVGGAIGVAGLAWYITNRCADLITEKHDD